MDKTLLQFVLTIMMYSIMGLVVGVGIVLVKKYPKLGDFIYKRPILGWTLAFAIGSVAMTLIMALIDVALITILSYMR